LSPAASHVEIGKLNF